MAGKKGGKRKGLGGLSPEKKKLLKQLIMKKAAEDMKKQAEEDAKIKHAEIQKRVKPLVLDGLKDDQLLKKVKDLYKKVCDLEEEKYDWEDKIRRQDFEINELTIKVNDIKGKFAKPMLKKVAKSESRLKKFDKEKKSKQGFRDELKSTGKSKYALEEENKDEKPQFGQDVLHKKEEEKKEDDAEEEGEAEEEEEEEEEE